MLGIVFGLLYFVYCCVVGNAAYESTTQDVFWFLRGWYVFWLTIISIFPILIGIFGSAITICGKGSERFAGAAITAFAPLLFIIIGLKAILLVGGAHLIYIAGEYGVPFEEWDMKKVVVGGIMVLVGIIFLRGSNSSSSSNS
jgi:hypothetical protein